MQELLLKMGGAFTRRGAYSPDKFPILIIEYMHLDISELYYSMQPN